MQLLSCLPSFLPPPLLPHCPYYMLYLAVHDVCILRQVLHDLHDLCPSLLVEYTQGTEVGDSLDEWVRKEVSRRRAERGIFLETHGEEGIKVLGPGACVIV